jgi:hypothetical protein
MESRRAVAPGFTKISARGLEQQRDLVVQGSAPGGAGRLASAGLPTIATAFCAWARTAVFRDSDDAWQAFIVAEGRAERVTLQAGLMTPQEVEVVGGPRE